MLVDRLIPIPDAWRLNPQRAAWRVPYLQWLTASRRL